MLTAAEPPILCRRDCRCRMCVRTALHVAKVLRKNDPRKQTRSRKAAREIDTTAALAEAMRCA